MKKLILATAIVFLAACGSSDDDSDDSGTGSETSSGLLQGIQFGATTGNVAETISALETAIDGIDPVSIVEQANAAANDLELRPTSVTLFGNPLLGTPLMQINQLAGLDLPQNMLAWEDETGQTNIAYNSADYLSGRHGLSAAQETLDTINTALNNLANAAAGQEITPVAGAVPSIGEGVVVVQSANDIDTTFTNLQQAIVSAEPLTLVTILDHSANAETVGLTLLPTRLLVFGNPNLGTPLMQSEQSIGIDLPQKMLVFEDAEGVVSIAYNDPAFLAERHGITDQQEILGTITTALGDLAAGAAGKPVCDKVTYKIAGFE